MLSTKPASSIHAHDVLDLIRETHLSTAALFEEAARRFGEGVTYHTCKLRGMTLPQLLEFFLAREKLMFEDGRLVVNEEHDCQGRH